MKNPILISPRKIILSLLLLSVAVFGSVQPAFAHRRIEIENYLLILGWRNEPVIVGERNALVVEIYDGDLPVAGVEATLELTVLYGGRTFVGILAPTGTPGIYEVEIYPTVRGTYQVHLMGMIEDVVVDTIVEPEEVLPASVLQFPQSQPDLAELQAEIEALQARMQMLQLISYLAIGTGIIGVGIAIFAMNKSKNHKENVGE